MRNSIVRTCESCGRVRFYSLNFLFSEKVCNECYLKAKERSRER
jgi:uncharacterized protein (DUF983 family)